MRICKALAIILMLGTSIPAYSTGPISKFITDRCTDECINEGPACDNCYSTAVDLFDQSDPVSPELNFDVDEDTGRLEFEF